MADKQAVKFRKIKGRIVPIRVDRELMGPKAIGTAKLVSAAAVGTGTALGSAALIRKSNKFFRQSAIIRKLGLKNAEPGTTRRFRSIKKSAKSFVTGQKFSNRAFALLGLGTLATSFLAQGSAEDLAQGRVNREGRQFIEAAAGTAAALGTIALFRGRAKLGGRKGLFRRIRRGTNPQTEMEQAFTDFRTRGRKMTRKAIREGRRAEQLALFPELEAEKKRMEKRRSFVFKFLKKGF